MLRLGYHMNPCIGNSFNRRLALHWIVLMVRAFVLKWSWAWSKRFPTWTGRWCESFWAWSLPTRVLRIPASKSTRKDSLQKPGGLWVLHNWFYFWCAARIKCTYVHYYHVFMIRNFVDHVQTEDMVQDPHIRYHPLDGIWEDTFEME
jgi:hypothetical protein